MASITTRMKPVGHSFAGGAFSLAAIIMMVAVGIPAGYGSTAAMAAADAPAGSASRQPEAGDVVDRVSFLPKFEAGRVTIFEQIAIVDGSQIFDGEPLPASNSSHLVMRVETLSVAPDGSAVISMTYDRISLTGDSIFGGKWAWDSDIEGPQGLQANFLPILQRLKAVQIIAIVNPDGKVESVKGTEEVVEMMQKQAQIAPRAGEFGPIGLSQMLESFWRLGIENDSRTLDEEWTEEIDTPAPGLGTLTVSSIYHVARVDASRATVDIYLDMTLALEVEGGDGDDDDDESEEEAEWTPPPPDSAELVTEEAGGLLVWDRERHELVERATRLSFTLEVTQPTIFGDQGTTTVVTKQAVDSVLRRISTDGEVYDEVDDEDQQDTEEEAEAEVDSGGDTSPPGGDG